MSSSRTGLPDRVFIGTAVVAHSYHRFNEEEAARFPTHAELRQRALSLTQVCVWPRALPVMAVWPKTAATGRTQGRSGSARLPSFPAPTQQSSQPSGGRAKRQRAEDDDEGTCYADRSTPLGDQERDEDLGRLPRARTALVLRSPDGWEIPMMRVAAIKAHVTMGTYGPHPSLRCHSTAPSSAALSGQR